MDVIMVGRPTIMNYVIFMIFVQANHNNAYHVSTPQDRHTRLHPNTHLLDIQALQEEVVGEVGEAEAGV